MGQWGVIGGGLKKGCTVQSIKVIFKVKYLKLKSIVWFLVIILCTVEKNVLLKGGH